MVDLTFIEKFTKGNNTKIRRYITMYLQSVPTNFEQMKLDLENQNWLDLAIKAHSLKPQAEFMGIEELKNTLIKIEDAVKNEEYTDLELFFETAQKLHLESESFLKNHLEGI